MLQSYPTFVSLGILVIGLLGILSVWLLLTRRQDKTVALELARNREQLAHLLRVATLGELSASIAHELNQPLAAILSNANAARRYLAAGAPDLDEIRSIVDDIAESGRRGGEMIHRLRTLLKNEPSDLRPLAINEVVHDTLRLVSGDAVVRHVQVEAELAATLPQIQGDRIQLQEVLVNLMVNAFDAVQEQPQGEGRVWVASAATKGRVSLTVRDSGPGLSPARLRAPFEPFISSKPEGLGVGLSISRSIVEAHGGRIGARNAPGGGAEFTVTFPAGEFSE